MELLDLADQSDQFKGLYEILISSKLGSPHAINLEIRTGQDYKRDFSELRLKPHPLEQFKPIEPRHFYVGQDQGRQGESLPISKGTGSRQIISGFYPVPGPMEPGLGVYGQASALKQIELIRSIFDCEP
jgi:hypothetical protein